MEVLLLSVELKPYDAGILQEKTGKVLKKESD